MVVVMVVVVVTVRLSSSMAMRSMLSLTPSTESSGRGGGDCESVGCGGRGCCCGCGGTLTSDWLLWLVEEELDEMGVCSCVVDTLSLTLLPFVGPSRLEAERSCLVDGGTAAVRGRLWSIEAACSERGADSKRGAATRLSDRSD